MKKSFDGVCQGSLELLSGRELDKFARSIRYGRFTESEVEDEQEDAEDDGDE
jgi:hypothetical protein